MSSSKEMREIAGQLLRLAEEADRTGVSLNQEPEGEIEGGTVTQSLRTVTSDSVYLCRLAEEMFRIRRLRDRQFGQELFADPAWDMLLDLYIQRSKGRQVSVTSICNASFVPGTTALRWLAIIQERGWVSRESDPNDRRRVYVGLTREGEVAIAQYLTSAARHIRLANPVPFMLVEEAGT